MHSERTYRRIQLGFIVFLAVIVIGPVFELRPKGWLTVSGFLFFLGLFMLVVGVMFWLIQVKFLPEDRANPNPRDISVHERDLMRGSKQGQTLVAAGACSIGLALIALLLQVIVG